MQNIFSSQSMENAHIYEFLTSPYESPFYSKSFDISHNDRRIGIIDQFNGKRPIIFNKDFFDKKKLELNIYQTLVLDSHIVDILHRYVSGIGKLDDNSKLVTRDFLVHVSSLNCDYNPVFYLTENFSKSSKEQFIKTSSGKLSSILKLHCMDEQEYINNNVIKYKKESVEHYCDKYKSVDLDNCGIAWANEFAENHHNNDYREITRLSYACLLKMVLIQFMYPKMSQENIIKKYYEFERFLIEDLNIILARELNLALYYFSNFAGKFVSVQPNMDVEGAKRALLSTAWDLLLLRIPEILLSPTHLPELNLSYIVTSEAKLLDIGDMFNISTVMYKDKKSPAFPILSFNVKKFEKVISEVNLDELNKHGQTLAISRITKAPKHISTQSVNWLIADLELQLSYLCK
ncbi:hypothetical protein SAMN05880558_10513 [Aeromonas sp. RU39B]|nr:hypothetical protein SAMN05880558_10513 [Aeromonas sp. RU39B]